METLFAGTKIDASSSFIRDHSQLSAYNTFLADIKRDHFNTHKTKWYDIQRA